MRDTALYEPKVTLLSSHLSRFLSRRVVASDLDKATFKNLIIQLIANIEYGNSCLFLSDSEKDFCDTLAGNNKNRIIGKAEENKPIPASPLVLWDNRLYLYRYYFYEFRLANQLYDRVAICPDSQPTLSTEKLIDLTSTLTDKTDQTTKQMSPSQQAGLIAVQRRLLILSGGPGTGKTTAVVKILAVLLQSLGSHLKIGLTAPTGKAALRLSDSVQATLQGLELDNEIKEAIPLEGQTLHRLLGAHSSSVKFFHNAKNPMKWDIVVVDEASMVDLAMMSKLVDSLKPSSRLILVGDKDQLVSVESGSVLADCITSLSENSVELIKTYRFNSAIKQAASGVKKGRDSEVWSLFTNPKIENLQLVNFSKMYDFLGQGYKKYMETVYDYIEDSINVPLESVFEALYRFQVLSATHFGPFGVEEINRRTELYLKKMGYPCQPGQYYVGRPVMVTKNDYSCNLFNGDIGICLPKETSQATSSKNSNEKVVWFRQAHGKYGHFPTYRLERCETAYCITIHKSQGSEYQDVAIVLPENESRVLSRELIYTAITRAKENVFLSVSKEIFKSAIGRKTIRASGLAELLERIKVN